MPNVTLRDHLDSSAVSIYVHVCVYSVCVHTYTGVYPTYILHKRHDIVVMYASVCLHRTHCTAVSLAYLTLVAIFKSPNETAL